MGILAIRRARGRGCVGGWPLLVGFVLMVATVALTGWAVVELVGWLVRGTGRLA